MKPEQHTARLQADVEQTLAELKTATQAPIPAVRERLERALEAARGEGHALFDDVRGATRRIAGQAADTLRHGRDSSCAYISHNPWRAAAIIGAIGVLLGAAISRRP